MYPEVERYQAACDAARAARSAAEPPEEGHDEETCVECAYEDAMDDAWSILAGSPEPLVRWIAEHCQGYEDQALVVLRALPATMDKLDALAGEHGWCDTWESFVRRAGYAGVLPAETAAELQPEASGR